MGGSHDATAGDEPPGFQEGRYPRAVNASRPFGSDRWSTDRRILRSKHERVSVRQHPFSSIATPRHCRRPELYSVPSTPATPSDSAMDRRVVFAHRLRRPAGFTVSTRCGDGHAADTDLTPDRDRRGARQPRRITAMRGTASRTYLPQDLGLIFQHPAPGPVSRSRPAGPSRGQAIFSAS